MGRSGSPSRRQAAERASSSPPSSFDEIAFELYGLTPGEFTAARDERVAAAKAAGDATLASSLGELRKPTQAAWLVNLLWRDQESVVEQLLMLGESFRTAQRALAGDQLRELSSQRQRLITGLGRHARRLALAAGIRVSSDTARDAEITLETAMADASLAERIRTGRLTQAASYSGFGPVAAGLVNSSPSSAQARPKVPAARKAPSVDARREAEATLAIASRDAAEASAKLTQSEAEVEDASRARDELRGRIEEMRYELRLLEDQVPDAERELRNLTRKRDQARMANTRAQRRLENAQQELDKLG